MKKLITDILWSFKTDIKLFPNILDLFSAIIDEIKSYIINIKYFFHCITGDIKLIIKHYINND